MESTVLLGSLLMAVGICLVVVAVIREMGGGRSPASQTLTTLGAGLVLLLAGQWLIR